MRLTALLRPTAGSTGNPSDGAVARTVRHTLIVALTIAYSLSVSAQTAAVQQDPVQTALVQTSPVQTPPMQLAIEGGLGATNNSGLSASGQERADLIATVRPKVDFFRRTARLELDLAAAAAFVGYVKGTQKDEVLPELRAFGRSELIERWLYFDAAAQVTQTQANSFGAGIYEFSTVNARTSTSFRASPYLLRDLSPTSFVLALYDLATTNNGADTGARMVSQRTAVRYESQPVPVGMAFEIARLDNETRGVDESRLTIDTARTAARVALQNQVILGAVAGVDRSDHVGFQATDPLYGLTLAWNPDPRTAVDMTLEHRFFGLGGVLALRHRTPSMAFGLSMGRGPATVTSMFGQVARGRSDLRPFIDAILASRYPDPTMRRALVESVVDSRALDARLPSPTSVVAGYPQLNTNARATWAYLGTRNTAALSLYMQTLQQLTHEDEPPPPNGAQNDSRQVGASFQVGRRLAPHLSADIVLNWSKFIGLAVHAGESSEEWVQRLVFSRDISPRTAVTGGFQHASFSSNASGQHDYKAALVFVGLRHSF